MAPSYATLVHINWPYGEDKLKEIHDILNSLDGSIQLTAETSCRELSFLDVMKRKDKTHLTTIFIINRRIHFNTSHIHPTIQDTLKITYHTTWLGGYV